jgi:hypothetical protein
VLPSLKYAVVRIHATGPRRLEAPSGATHLQTHLRQRVVRRLASD